MIQTLGQEAESMSRTSISKSVRFEVFKRDSFSCQYCGRKAPDVLLEVDHIDPVAKGGSNAVLNLLTACKDCNSGKSDKKLSETTVLDKQRAQLADLQERREQIDMMFQWQQGLVNLEDDVITRLHELWRSHVRGYHLTDNGLRELRVVAKKYGVDEIVTAMRIATQQYLRFDGDMATSASVTAAWSKVSGICRVNRLEKTQPELKRIYYIRGILRSRLDYCDEVVALRLLTAAVDLNASVDGLERFAKSATSWTTWREGMENFIDEKGSGDAEGPTSNKEN